MKSGTKKTTGKSDDVKKSKEGTRRAFATQQSQERLMFVLALTLHSPVRSAWVKERSSYWWGKVSNSTFTPPYDWLEDFRMSHATFVYLCNELRSLVEKSDTVMRRVIPVEQ